ncbi:MAG: AAA family ATPase, partial [Desulfopila sp.]
NEIDLLYPSGSSFIPIMIKSSRIYRGEFLKGIRYFQKLSGSSQPGILIYDGELEIEKEEAVVKNFRNVWP